MPEHPIVAALLDFSMRPMEPIRGHVVPLAAGRVLEIGVGTGLNAARYDPSRITEIVGIEPDPHMLKRARPRFEAAPYPARLVQAGAEALPFDDRSFDEVVCTFVLCTIPDVRAAVREMFRVLVPGGTLHFAEHTRSDHRPTMAVQRALQPAWAFFAGGCQLSRDPVGLLEEAGFELVAVHGHGRGLLNVTPVLRGCAVRPLHRGTAAAPGGPPTAGVRSPARGSASKPPR